MIDDIIINAIEEEDSKLIKASTILTIQALSDTESACVVYAAMVELSFSNAFDGDLSDRQICVSSDKKIARYANVSMPSFYKAVKDLMRDEFIEKYKVNAFLCDQKRAASNAYVLSDNQSHREIISYHKDMWINSDVDLYFRNWIHQPAIEVK